MTKRAFGVALVFLMASVLPRGALAEQPIAGHWEGAISIMGQDLGIKVDFRSDATGLKASIDIPMQGAIGLPLTNVKFETPKVHFELPAGPGLAVFDGEMKGDQISGSFSQSGMTGTFQLKRAQAAPEAAGPRPTLPYKEEEVAFKNGDVTLAGTLTLPASQAPVPAVVLITGSGPQNRDEEIFGFKPFRLIADHLGRNGVAVLRYDDRGVGASTGSINEGTTEDFAKDALAGVAFLKTRPAIDPKRIGLCGHSEGGVVAPIAAARSNDVAFIVLIAGMGVTGEKILFAQGEAIARADGAPDEAIRKQIEFQKRTFEAVRTGKGWDELRADLQKQARAQVEKMPEAQRKAITDVDQYVNMMVNAQLAMPRSAWFKYFLDYDPATSLEKVHCPVLALFGEHDLQVPAEMNAKAISEALARAGNKDVTIKIIPKANHLFEEAVTGSPSEYDSLAKEFVPGFLDTLTSWIRQKNGLGATPPAAAAASAVPAPAKAGEASPQVSVAESFLRKLVAEEFSSASQAFDATMAAAMPPYQLRDTWKGLLAQSGAFRDITERREAAKEGNTIVDFICAFERGPLVVRVVVSPDGKVSGLWFLPVERAIPASAPSGK